MRRFSFLATPIVTLAICLIGDAPVRAQNSKFSDRIKIHSSDKSVLCDIESLGKDQFSVATDEGTKTINVSDIESIVFGREPPKMREARKSGSDGDYEKALKELEEVKPDDLDRDVVRNDLSYLRALFSARLMLSGGGSGEEEEAGADPAVAAKKAAEETIVVATKMLDYLKQNPTSFHYYEANEVIGDLMTSIGRFDSSQKFYDKLAESPDAAYKARANLLRGRVTLASGKYDDAMKAFDGVLANPAKGKLGAQQAVEAKIGRTYSLAGSGKVAEAIKTLQEIIASADDGDIELLGRAYNALGNCYRKQKDGKQALWAYLRTDLLYSTVADVHAEALANLTTLWADAKHPERALEAKNALHRQYPYSRWTKQLR